MNRVEGSVRKLVIPIVARVSVFGHAAFPVLNSTTAVSYVQVWWCG